MALNKSSVTYFGRDVWGLGRLRVWVGDNICGSGNASLEVEEIEIQQLHQDSSKITQSLNFFVRLNEFVIP